MAKRSKSRFTDLVKFIPDSEQELEEDNNEIRTNLLDDKYDDNYDEYDEYDAYNQPSQEAEVEEEAPIEEVIEQEAIESIDELYEEDTTSGLIEDDDYEEETEDAMEIKTTSQDFDLSDLQEENDNTYQGNTYKEDNKMKREIPDFVREDKIPIEEPVIKQPTPVTPGAQRFQAQHNSAQSPVLDPSNMKESIILGNTTIKGDVITDTGIQIYGAVIGNIESGGRVQLMGKVEGDITGKSVIITDTSLNGNIHAENDVMVKSGCVVTGDVSGNKIVLNGTINGNVDADGQVDFEAGSIIDGNVSAKSFNIKPGARINGSIATK